ncbi:hypothetical protein [Anthocerotibacter panamensis]|uniref:hypothetical protein n=1 Tax=Anthocerotibacter panamensis TaxID=2857077 RepID=UPI001C4039DF|nr:hypothetical protein [Anthocerotibacter panamensis]
MRKWTMSMLFALLLGMPAGAGPLPSLDDFAQPPAPTEPLPSLDDYALNAPYKPPTRLSPSPRQQPDNQGVFQVLGTKAILLIPGQTVVVPVRGQVNGVSLENAQLVGIFLPEGEVAGRLVFEQLVSQDQRWEVTARTDLLPARVRTDSATREQELLARELQAEQSLINNIRSRSRRSFNSRSTDSLTAVLLNLLGLNGRRISRNGLNSFSRYGSSLNLNPYSTPLGGAYAYGNALPSSPSSLPPVGSSYQNYGGGALVEPDLSISQTEATLRAYEERLNTPRAIPALTGELQPGQSLYVTFTGLR